MKIEFSKLQWHLVLVIHLLGVGIIILVMVMLFMMNWMRELTTQTRFLTERLDQIVQSSVPVASEPINH